MTKGMKKGICLLIGWVFLLAQGSTAAVAQPDSHAGYYIDKNTVVFVFDTRDYAKTLLSESADKMDFSDLNIYEVALTGDFNNWSRDGWKMKKTGAYTYELRKKVSDFNDRFPMEFKYVINGLYFADPKDIYPDKRKFSNKFLTEIYNMASQEVQPSPTGNAFFYLDGYENAREVILAGEFNNWNEHALKMTKIKGGWQTRLDLPPGRYEYKFIADGQWTHDPENPNYVGNEHGTLNSVLLIGKRVTFELKGYADAGQVMLVGSFNNWSQINMEKKGDSWFVSLDLAGGKHLYKFIVDGKWVLDPENRMKENDHTGISHSVLIVR